MKRVLLGAAALALFAGPALGDIINSAHDLSTNSTYTRQGLEDHGGDIDQICAYCHTPHKSADAQNAPLWNRTNPSDATVEGYTYYNSATLTSAAQPTAVKLTVADSDVPLCMSCHDGTSLGTSALYNPVGEDQVTAANVAELNSASTALLLDATNSLMNDHPVGFNYDTAATNDTGLETLAQAKTNGAKFYGGSANMMWCSSCHAVHEPGDGSGLYPFLRVTSDRSALCLACHNK
jgi:cytochrome c2